jgi:hypothetical protein
MADAATTDPADMDPISQTFAAANALNVKHFVDKEFQYSNMMLTNAINFQQQQQNHISMMNTYALQAMQRTEAVNNAIVTKASSILLDQTANDLGDAAISQETVKVAQTTPPVYQDPGNNLAQLSAQIALMMQTLNQITAVPAKT